MEKEIRANQVWECNGTQVSVVSVDMMFGKVGRAYVQILPTGGYAVITGWLLSKVFTLVQDAEAPPAPEGPLRKKIQEAQAVLVQALCCDVPEGGK